MLEDYPNSFSVDLNGKTNSWEATVLIPFVDEAKVIAEEAKLF
jgi:5'-3' exoribonuclease 1